MTLHIGLPPPPCHELSEFLRPPLQTRAWQRPSICVETLETIISLVKTICFVRWISLLFLTMPTVVRICVWFILKVLKRSQQTSCVNFNDFIQKNFNSNVSKNQMIILRSKTKRPEIWVKNLVLGQEPIRDGCKLNFIGWF